MRFILSILTTVAASLTISAIASADEACDLMINMTVGLDGPAVVKNGALSVDTKSPDYKGDLVAGVSAKVMMPYFPTGYDQPYVATTDVRVEKVQGGVRVSRRAITAAKFPPSELVGFESEFRTETGGGCEPVSTVGLYRFTSGEVKRVVYDKQYCDEVRTILGKQGSEAQAREKLRTCTDFLGDVREAYGRRKAELASKKIIMSDSIGPMSVPQLASDEQAGAGLVLGLMAMCSPRGWDEFSESARTQLTRGSGAGKAGKTAK